MVSLLLVVQVPDTRDVGGMAVLLRPVDGFPLGLEGGEDVVGVVLNHVVVDRVSLGTTLRPWLNIDVRYFGLSLLLRAARGRAFGFLDASIVVDCRSKYGHEGKNSSAL